MSAEEQVRTAGLTAAQFGREFVATAANPSRVAAIVGQVLGEEIRFGPVKVGPGGMASSKAVGVVQSVEGCLPDSEDAIDANHTGDDADEHIRRMVVKTRVALRVTTLIGGRLVRFHAVLGTRLRVTVTLQAPLVIVITIAPLADEDIALDLTMPALAARALRRLGNIDELVRLQVREYVQVLLADPEVVRYTRFDITALVDRAFAGGLVFPPPRTTSGRSI